MKKNLLLLSLFAITFSSCTHKLADLESKTDLSKKAKADFNRSKIKDNGRGFSVDMEKLGHMPKKVALVSFYVDDPGLFKQTKGGTTITYTTTNTGSANARVFANNFYSKSIDALKASFKANDMDLLTPSEFLTDDDKKQFYNDFVVKHTSLANIGDKLGKFFKKLGNAGTTIETDEAADGFKLLKINKREMSDYKKKSVGPANLGGCSDAEMIESIGYDLCKNLEVDAVVIIFNTQLSSQKWGKDKFWLGAVSMHMFGPNPLPLKEGKKDNMFYSKGIWYAGYRTTFKKGLLINSAKRKSTEDEKKVIEQANTTAYNNIVNGLANKMSRYMKKELGTK